MTIAELFDRNNIIYKPVDCSKDDFFFGLPADVIQYLNCMGSPVYLNKTVYGSAYTTLFSIDEMKNEQYEICMENNLLIIGYGLNGDLLTLNLSNSKVGYVFHDELTEESFDEFQEIYVEMPLKIEEFIEMAIENKNYPIDGTMAEKY